MIYDTVCHYILLSKNYKGKKENHSSHISMTWIKSSVCRANIFPSTKQKRAILCFLFLFLFFFLHIYLFLIQPFVVFLYIDTTHWMNSKVMHAPKNTEWYICMARVWNAPIILEESASTSACRLRKKLLHSPLSLSTQPRSNGSSKVTLIFFIFL